MHLLSALHIFLVVATDLRPLVYIPIVQVLVLVRASPLSLFLTDPLRRVVLRPVRVFFVFFLCCCMVYLASIASPPLALPRTYSTLAF